MKETDEIDLKIKIASQQVTLHQALKNQDFVRDVESRIEELWQTWRIRFPNLTEARLLAMMVYQYASFYFQMRQRYESAEESAQRAVAALNSALAEEALANSRQ